MSLPIDHRFQATDFKPLQSILHVRSFPGSAKERTALEAASFILSPGRVEQATVLTWLHLEQQATSKERWTTC